MTVVKRQKVEPLREDDKPIAEGETWALWRELKTKGSRRLVFVMRKPVAKVLAEFEIGSTPVDDMDFFSRFSFVYRNNLQYLMPALAEMVDLGDMVQYKGRVLSPKKKVEYLACIHRALIMEREGKLEMLGGEDEGVRRTWGVKIDMREGLKK
jgi:hypothetical protein